MDSKFAECMAKNGKENNHTSHIARIVHLLMNGENYKMYKIVWYEGGLHLADTDTKNVCEHDLNPRMKYIMVRIDNWDRTLVQ